MPPTRPCVTPARSRSRMCVPSASRGSRARRLRALVTSRACPGYARARASRLEESHGIEEEEGRKGRNWGGGRREGGDLEPVRPAPRAGRRAARQPADRVRVGEEGLRAHVERQGPREGALRRQEDAARAEGGRVLAEGSGRR